MMNNFQKYYEYARDDLDLWTQIKGCRFVHSSDSIGACIIRDIKRANGKNSITIYLDQLNSDRKNIPLDAAFIYQKPSVCLEIEIPKEIIDHVEDFFSNQSKEPKEKTLRKSPEQFQAEIVNSYKSNFYYIPMTPTLLDDDIRLAWIWRDNLRSEEIRKIHRMPIPNLKNSKDYHWGKMLSARAAEKALFSFFQKANYKVKDISISQLDSNENLWKLCDLQVDDMLVDVKNARNNKRRDSEAPDNYVDFCVPAYKHDTRSDRNIWIAGAFSNYLWPSALVSDDKYYNSTEILFLGLTKREWIEELSLRFDIPDQFSLIFSRRNDSYKYLPPWAFVYPDRFYSLRDNILDSLFSRYQISDIIELTKPSILPYFLAKGINPIEYNLEVNRNWEMSLVELITGWTKEICYKHSLPFLFCSIFNHFMQMVNVNSNGGDTEDFNPDKYRKFLFVQGLTSYPLMIYDPLWTIDNLIRNLETLWDKSRYLLAEYRIFKLSNALILKGYKDKYSDPDTLIAYCGGRLPDDSYCGHYPLIVGQNKICSDCGHLVCNQCYFCSQKCYREKHEIKKIESYSP